MESLTDRELEVSRLVASGFSNREIGEQLKISEQTVKNHTRAIYRKMTVSNRVELTIRFYGGSAKKWNRSASWRAPAKSGERAGTGSARRRSV
jgi:Response regulator containing a CheY-like receiver domain and an HTH DNA-binding domain